MFRQVIITSGPTVEPIDPVRFISNRSSGKTGFHLATEALNRDIGKIVYITGPSRYTPADVTLVPVETALEMREQLLTYRDESEVIIMAAAVGDYRVIHYSSRKIRKNDERLVLELTRNPDLLKELGLIKEPHQILVGFAAETHSIMKHAEEKLAEKNLDLLVLNEISAENPAFDVDENQVYLVTAAGFRKLEKMAKSLLAVYIWDEIESIAESRNTKD
jgi:phosphopantothenoylcysteine decarboxylase/phosphopantothenate--cysteine ligase